MTPADFPMILAGLSEKSAEYFAQTLTRMAEYEAEGVLLKVEFDWVRGGVTDAFESAWKALVRARFTYAGKWESLTDAERKLEQALFMPYPHVVAGYLKRAEKAKDADGVMRGVMIQLLREMVPLAARLAVLKTKIGKRAPKVTKTSIERDARDAKSMTCQTCARSILAETGVIAHHGYERPGQGWQTASCDGARALPFEVSRETLGEHISRLQEYVAHQKSFLVKLKAETVPIHWSYEDNAGKVNSWDKAKTVNVSVTRETWDAILAEAMPKMQYAYRRTFDELKESRVHSVSKDIEHTEAHIVRQQKRYDGWKQTHERQGEEWVKLGAAA